MKSIKESLQNSVNEEKQRFDSLVDDINIKRNPSANPKVDSWGHPLQVGDLVLAVSDGRPFTQQGKWMSDNNLIVGNIVEFYRGGMYVAVLNKDRLDDNKNNRFYDWSAGNAEIYDAVIVAVKIKSGVIKISDTMLGSIFR